MIDLMQPPNLFYRGSSMKGTFKPGDKLVIEKIPSWRINKGDLIIFGRKRGDKNDFIVHRVVNITPDGLVTRGDNCFSNDGELVIKENIVGRVIQYDRLGQIHKVANAQPGQLRAAALHGRLQAIRLIKSILRRPYLKIRETGLIAKIWQPEIEVFYFETSNGPLVKYVHKGRTVAVCRTDEECCCTRNPYNLILGSIKKLK